MKPCPLCTIFSTAGPKGTGSEPPAHTHMCMRAHVHIHTHTQWTQHKYTGLRLQDPRGRYILSLAFRAQPAPETALGRASSGQAGAKHLGLPCPGEGTASLHSRHCLKENGGTVPTWRASGGICLSARLALMTSPTSLVSASQEGKGQSRKMAPRAPPPELDWWRMGLVLPRNGALMISRTPPWPSRQGPPLTHGRGARPGFVHKVVRA